jgi:hypothetical protein
MNENPILRAHIYVFFPPLLYPKIFPPPTYHLPTPPPSFHRQNSRDIEQERAWSRGAWSGGAAGARAGPTRHSGKHLTFFSFIYFLCLFVELRCTRYAALHRNSTNRVCSYGAALQRSITKKATAATPRRNRRQLPSPASPRRGAALQLHEGGDGSCRRLFLPAAELRSSTKEVTTAIVASLSPLRSCAAAQLQQGGCRHLLLPATELRYITAPRRRRR